LARSFERDAKIGRCAGTEAFAAEEARGLTVRVPFGKLERETGIEPATLGLGRRKRPDK